MFKKNPTRPTIKISLKKTSEGYRIIPNESFSLFTTRNIVRSIYRPDLINMINQNMEGNASGNLTSGTMIQPPSHVTIPSVASWFNIEEIHKIEMEYFPEFFREDIQSQTFSFSVKNSNLYMYIRNLIISMWRQNSKKYISPSVCRKNIPGDVSSIMRIHGFLENWGLINFPSKEHIKGQVIRKAQILQCYVCESEDCPHYYASQIEDVIFQICQNCFQNNVYPQSIKKAEFKKIILQKHFNDNEKTMDKVQITRMLQILNGIPNGLPKQKDRDSWSVIQKQFPEFSRQQIVKNFLKLPLNNAMNSCIFENCQEILTFDTQQEKKQIFNIDQPSIFQDFQNPILGSIAMNFYKWKQYKIDSLQVKSESHLQNGNGKMNKSQTLLDKIFQACESHAKYLAKGQQEKVKNLTKMLIEVILSKLELKSIFISQYRNLVNVEQKVVQKRVANDMVEVLKKNLQVFDQQQQCYYQQKQKAENEINANIQDTVRDQNPIYDLKHPQQEEYIL